MTTDETKRLKGGDVVAATASGSDRADRFQTALSAHQKGHLAQARALYEEVLADDPDHADAIHLLGVVAFQEGRHPESIDAIRRAISMNPNKAVFFGNLGNALKESGDLDEARDAYDRALAINPDFIDAHYNRVGMVRFEAADPAFDRLHELLKASATGPADRMKLHFTLGKMYADIGETDAAFEQYRLANEARKAHKDSDFSIDDVEKTVALLIRTFDRSFFESRTGFGLETAVPVFIVGMPRSGTTLVEQILASHPKVYGAGEIDDIERIFQSLGDHRLSGAFVRIARGIESGRSRELAGRYLDRLKALAPHAERVTDKMPQNFLYLWLIALLFPNATIFHCRRDPMDTCLSCYFTDFQTGHGYKNDLTTLGRYYRQYIRLMEHWGSVLPVPVREVRYEDLVDDPEGGTRRLIEESGLPWDERCLRFYDTQRSVGTASVTQVRRPIYRSSVGRWRQYARHLTPLQTALGKMAAPPFDVNAVLKSAVEDHQKGRLQEAEAGYRRILEAAPAHGDALHLLGVLSCQTGRHDEGERLIRSALKGNPNNPVYLDNLGNALRAAGKPEDALAAYRRAAAASPGTPNAGAIHLKMARFLKSQGRLDEAAASYAASLAVTPNRDRVRLERAECLSAQGKTAEAVSEYARYLERHPSDSTVLGEMGAALNRLGRYPESVAILDRAIAQNPEVAQHHTNRGIALRKLGRVDEAVDAYQTAIQLEPNDIGAYYNQMHLKIYEPDDPAFKTLETLYRHGTLSSANRMYLHFTLGKMYADIGEHDRAFHHYHQANETRKSHKGQDFDIREIRGAIVLLMELCDAGYFRDRRESGIAAELPVFVVGMPRSGTTLVEQILASHPEVHGAGELHDIGKIYHTVMNAASQDAFIAAIRSLDLDRVRASAEQYLARIEALGKGARRVVDKMPQNFLYLWLIAIMFPGARVIHIRRDPLDTCLSCYFTDFNTGHGYKNDLGDLGSYYALYQALMAHWGNVLPIPILNVTYEELISDPETASREMVEFCGLEWNERCLEFHRHQRAVQTASVTQVRRPIYHSSVGKWRHYERHIEPLKAAIAADPLGFDADGAMRRAVTYHQQGMLESAEALYRKVLAEAPDNPDASHLLGVLSFQRGEATQGVELIQQATRIDPDNWAYFNNLGTALKNAGRVEEAIDAYLRAIDLKPDHHEPHYNLGVALADAGRTEEAIERYRHATTLKPDYCEAFNNMGNALKSMGRLDEAIDSYQRAIKINPDYAKAYNNLGSALSGRFKFKDAVAAFQRAIALNPEYHEAYNNLGAALKDRGQLSAAIRNYRKAIALKPDYYEAHNNLANALNNQGKLEEAVTAYRHALDIKPECHEAHDNLLLTLQYLPDHDPAQLRAEHDHWDVRHARHLAEEAPPHGNDRSPDRRIRVGFVSHDFGRHPVGYFLVAYLAAHDPDAVEVVCYSDRVQEDDMTETIRSHSALWRRTVGVRDEPMADQIREDGIDILVDMSGHTAKNRLMVFARRPAPVQVTWLAYPGTTGMAAMDYLIADRWVAPPGMDDAYAESLLRLPESYLCYEPPDYAPDVNSLPALENGHLTFGCFNNLAKVTPAVISLWGRILRAVPDARLLLKYRSFNDKAVQDRYRELLAGEGIAEDRIDLIGASASHVTHLSHFNRIDVALDPFPYNGTTTTCETLYMGVPVISLAGQTFVSRQGCGILENVGLSDWIPRSYDAYVERAVTCVDQLDALNALRGTLRQRVADSPLCDAGRFARHLEAGFRQIWRRWCDGMDPWAVTVERDS